VSLLLEHNALYDLEATAPWQDKPDHGLTPLHVAARMGHAAVVEVLIEAGAEYDTRRLWFQGNSSPLRDAIQRCHMDVVRLLVP
ncbi:Aspg, partial [Symbiodinium sp. KB8]